MSELLRTLRIRAGFTSVAAAAAAIGVERATVYAWEAGSKEPDKANLRTLAEVYGATDADRAELARHRAFGSDDRAA